VEMALRTVVFILVIASFVQLVEIVLRKTVPALYRSLGIFLPLITTNCAVMGVALLNTTNAGQILDVLNQSRPAGEALTALSFSQATFQGFCAGIGFTIAMLLMAGMVGTTMGAILYVVRSILVQEKGWTVADLKNERRDALISVSMMFILSVAVMAAAAGTLHPLGLKVDNAIDMVRLMEPLAGRFAVSIFVGGIVAAGLSSLFPIVLLAPWLFADFNNKPRNMRSTSSRLLVAFGVLLGLVVPVFGGRPVLVMIVSQALTAIASPVVLALMLIIYNRRSVMGVHTAGLRVNVIFGVVLLFVLAMAAAGVIGIVGQCNGG